MTADGGAHVTLVRPILFSLPLFCPFKRGVNPKPKLSGCLFCSSSFSGAPLSGGGALSHSVLQSPTDPIPRSAACRSPPSAPRLAASIQKGGDALGRLASTHSVKWGASGSVEGCPSCYTHLLHVDI